MRLKYPRNLLWISLALYFGGCSEGRVHKIGAPTQPTSFTSLKEARWLKADSLWELRQRPEQAIQSLKGYRKAAEKQKKVPELLTRLSHANYFVATYIESHTERSEALYREGAEVAEQALLCDPRFKKIREESGDETEAVQQVDGPYLEAAFWYAANLGRIVNLGDAKTRIGNRQHLEAFIKRVLLKNDSLYYGGAHRFLGIMYLVLPNPQIDSARSHFQMALQVSPLFFATRTLMAEYLCVKEKDTTAFREQLRFVLHTSPDTLLKASAENFYEQKRAEKLLAAESRLFR